MLAVAKEILAQFNAADFGTIVIQNFVIYQIQQVELFSYIQLGMLASFPP